MYPLVSELAVDGIPVVVSCRVLKLARQPYYRWAKNPVSRRELDEAYRAYSRSKRRRTLSLSYGDCSWKLRTLTRIRVGQAGV